MSIIKINLALVGLFLLLISCADQSSNSTTEVVQPTPKEFSELAKKGKTLFLQNCASCHNMDMISDMTGPALSGAEERWGNKDELVQFIQNPQELINSNHEYAVKVSTLWPSEMTPFPDLDRSSIEAILRFVKEKSAEN